MDGELFGNSVIQSMACRLKEEFPDIPIYIERSVQNRKLPAFFIGIVNTHTNKMMNNQYRMTWQMQVRYQTPANQLGIYTELNKTGMNLTYLLDCIYLQTYEDAKIREQRGTNIDYKIDDGVLLFFVDYEMNIIRYKNPDPFMRKLAIKERTKEE